jgi:hypothetical protein
LVIADQYVVVVVALDDTQNVCGVAVPLARLQSLSCEQLPVMSWQVPDVIPVGMTQT